MFHINYILILIRRHIQISSLLCTTHTPHIMCPHDITMRVWLLVCLIISGGQHSDLVQAASLTPAAASNTETETKYPCGVKPDFRGDVGTVNGGEEAEKHEYPWMVYVCGEYEYEYEYEEDSEGKGAKFTMPCNEACGGTLISTKGSL